MHAVQPSEIYRAGRESVTRLVRGSSPVQLAMLVRGCPEWTVRDLVAHLTGVAADANAGRMAGAPGERWTQAQVMSRRHRSLGELLAEWEQEGTRLEQGLDGSRAGTTLAGDAVIHDADLRETYALPSPLSEPAHWAVLETLVRLADRRFRAVGLPRLQVVADGDEWLLGEGPVAGAVRADLYELYRGLAGRRSFDAMAGWDWKVAPEPYLPHLPLFTPPPD